MWETLLKPKSPSNSPQICWEPMRPSSSGAEYLFEPGTQVAPARPASLVAKRICVTPAAGTRSVSAREATTVPPRSRVKSGEKSTLALAMVATEAKAPSVAITRTRTESPCAAAPASNVITAVSPGAAAG